MAHNVYPPERPLPCSQHQSNYRTSNRSSKIPSAALRLEVKWERTHRQEQKTNRLKNKRDQPVNRKKIPSIYTEQISHLQSGNQTDVELRNRTVGNEREENVVEQHN